MFQGMKKRVSDNGFAVFLFLLSLLATVKLCFFNLNIDEEYAITLSCRILSEDEMFRDIWEPHQTSGFLTAFLSQVWLWLTGSCRYLVLYLRAAGALIQAGISFFLYRTLRLNFSRIGAMTAAFFFYNTLPKQIQTPEFSNMLLWFSVLAMLCLFRACHSVHPRVWLIASGTSLCGLVLAYPSCILAVPAYFLCLKKLRAKTALRDGGTVLAVCVLLGTGYLGYFLGRLGLEGFLFGLRQMMTDTYHSDTLWQRAVCYGRELLTLLPHLLGTVLVAGVLCFLYDRFVLKRKGKHGSRRLFFCCILCVSCGEQILIWLGDSLNFHYPLLHFYLLYGVGLVAYGRKGAPDRSRYRTLFWSGSVWGGCVWLAALLITNTTLSVTGSYLMAGFIPSILLLTEDLEGENGGEGAFRYRLPVLLVLLALLGTSLFAKGFMVCENQGLRSNIFVVRQKVLSGPAQNIYDVYLDGYAYNSYAELLEGKCGMGDALLYVGNHSLYYLLTDSRIAVPSTISTPSFDGRLLEYWSYFPEHYPTVVVIDYSYRNTDEIDFVKKALKLGDPTEENGEFAVYRIGEKSERE